MADIWNGFLIIAVVVVVLLLVFRRVTVFEYQRGLKYRKGRFVSVLGPGQYWVYKPSTAVRLVEARQRFVTIGGQEVLSSDGVVIKVSLAASYEVADPAKAVNEIEDCESALYLVLQIALRAIIAATSIEELTEKRVNLGPRLAEEASPSVAQLGLRLISVDVKDIMLSGEVKKLFTQVVKARKEGQVALELARGETAAMRNLANIAGLMDAHPALLQLRALQQLAISSGNTLVLGLPPDVAAVSRGRESKASQGSPPTEAPSTEGESSD